MLLIISTCFLACNSNNQSHREQVKFDQYMVEGQRLYQLHCSNCHQLNGEGVGTLYPPISQSDFLINNTAQVACLIRNGISGEIKVNGVKYNQTMPGVAHLTNLEIAEITTYVYNTWGRKQGIIGVKQLEEVLNKCK